MVIPRSFDAIALPLCEQLLREFAESHPMVPEDDRGNKAYCFHCGGIAQSRSRVWSKQRAKHFSKCPWKIARRVLGIRYT